MTKSDKQFQESIMKTFDLGVKIKAALIKKGKRKGWTKCPRCGGKINAVLAGHKDHLHMSCEKPGCCWLME